MAAEDEQSLLVLLPPSLGVIKSTARAEVVEPRLQRALGLSVRVTVADSYAAVSSAVENDSASMVWAPAAIFQKHVSSAQRALRSSRLFGENQRAALVARTDAGLTISALRGKRASWVDPQSTSGYLMAKRWLASQEIMIDELLAEQKFTGSFSKCIDDVLDRKVDLTSIFLHGKSTTDFQRSLEEIRGGSSHELEPIALTDPLPADGVLISPALAPELAKQLSWLLRAPGDPVCFRSICSVEEFVEVDRDGRSIPPKPFTVS